MTPVPRQTTPRKRELLSVGVTVLDGPQVLQKEIEVMTGVPSTVPVVSVVSSAMMSLSLLVPVPVSVMPHVPVVVEVPHHTAWFVVPSVPMEVQPPEAHVVEGAAPRVSPESPCAKTTMMFPVVVVIFVEPLHAPPHDPEQLHETVGFVPNNVAPQ